MLTRKGRPAVSIIVPLYRERAVLPELMATLEPFVGLHEIVLVDGGSDDGTHEALVERGVGRVIRASCGRACQMNAGAREATGHVYLFLHADTAIEHEGPERALAAIDRGADGGCFGVRIASGDPRLGVGAALQTLRSRLMPSATGDQALFVRAEIFHALGGFSEDHPICEDLDFVERFVDFRGAARFVCLDAYVTTSARRWEQSGVTRTILGMWTLRALYHAGARPRWLANFYRTVR